MAQIGYPDDPGNDLPWSENRPTPTTLGTDPTDLEKRLKEMGGNLYNPTDLEGAQRNLSYTDAQGNARTNMDAVLKSFGDIYKQRAGSTNDRKVDSQSQMGNALYGSGTGNRTNAPGGPTSSLFTAPNYTSQFTDPISQALEAFSQQQVQRLTNPPEGSGQSLLENALRSIAGQFQQGGYTPAEQEVLQTQAIDPLERLRTARKQQVTQELARRGIDPRSGVALQMMQDVDRQFDSTRAQTQRSIAGQAAQETQSRMLQALSLLSNLAGTQDQRLNQAFQYQSVPLNLADRAWNQSMQLYSQNNPLSLIQPLLALSGQQQGRSDSQSAALADLVWALTHMGGA